MNKNRVTFRVSRKLTRNSTRKSTRRFVRLTPTWLANPNPTNVTFVYRPVPVLFNWWPSAMYNSSQTVRSFLMLVKRRKDYSPACPNLWGWCQDRRWLTDFHCISCNIRFGVGRKIITPSGCGQMLYCSCTSPTQFWVCTGYTTHEVVPGVVITKSLPSVIFSQVIVSHIYATPSTMSYILANSSQSYCRDDRDSSYNTAINDHTINVDSSNITMWRGPCASAELLFI